LLKEEDLTKQGVTTIDARKLLAPPAHKKQTEEFSLPNAMNMHGGFPPDNLTLFSPSIQGLFHQGRRISDDTRFQMMNSRRHSSDNQHFPSSGYHARPRTPKQNI
jgi:hypothetical protein